MQTQKTIMSVIVTILVVMIVFRKCENRLLESESNHYEYYDHKLEEKRQDVFDEELKEMRIDEKNWQSKYDSLRDMYIKKHSKH